VIRLLQALPPPTGSVKANARETMGDLQIQIQITLLSNKT
jgi:hypothetical protein